MFVDAIRPFIRTYEEARFYVDNGYKSVEWYGNYALIVDVSLNYYSEKYKATNRQLILSGRSPVVPEHEEQTFDLHHVGQKIDSPIACIPSGQHNGPELYSVFHPSSTSDEDLHTTAFELQRKKFWLLYVQKCEENHGFNNIPFLNPKVKI